MQYICNMPELREHCCIHIPSLRLQIVELTKPELAGKPFAIATQSHGILAVVEALSPAARRLRIPPGIRIADLQARWPQVPLVPPAPEAEQRIAHELLRLADLQTPIHRFEEDSLFLDLSGTARLHGPDRASWANRFLASITQHTGLRHFRTAFADSPRTAELIARATRQSTPLFCSPGHERGLLAPIPLRLLHRLTPRIHKRLRLYNLSTLGDIQKLERQFLHMHFGSDGEQLYALAQGLNLSSDSLCETGPVSIRTTLPCDTADELRIQAELHKLCDQLVFTLRRRQATARQMRLILQFSDSQECTTLHKWDNGTDDFHTLLSACRHMLEQALQRRVAVRCIELVVSQPQQGSMQIDLFQADGHRQTSLGQSIDKVRQKLGFEAVLNGSALLAPSTKYPAQKSAVRRAD